MITEYYDYIVGRKMLIYLLLPLMVLYCIFLSRVTIERNSNWDQGEIFVGRNTITLLLWMLPLLVLAAFKGIQVGVDYPMYYGFFANGNFKEIEAGISFFYSLAIKYDNFLVFSIGTYSLFLFFILIGIKKNSPNFLISILFFLLTYMYLNSFNQLRQMIAVSIIFCFANYLISKDKIDRIKFICIVLIALLFHNSAIFLFSLLLVPKKKLDGRVVIPMFLITIVLYFIPEFKNIIGGLIIDISGIYQSKYSSSLDFFFTVNKEKGLLQLLPIIAQMIIVSISLYFPFEDSKKLQLNNDLYNISTNIVIINLVLYSLAGIEAIDRIQLYFSIFNIYYYSYLVHVLLNSDSKRYGQLFAFIIIAFWCLYYVLRLVINIAGVVPYSFFY